MRSVLILAIASLAVVSAAQAEVFKWVDDKGVVNYANAPPADKRKAVTLDSASPNVSTYSSTEADRSKAAATQDSKLKERVDGLEKQLEAERRSRQAAAELALQQSQQQQARVAEQKKLERERCIADRRVDCDDPAATPSAAYPVPLVVVRRPPVIVPAVPITLPIVRPSTPAFPRRSRPLRPRDPF